MFEFHLIPKYRSHKVVEALKIKEIQHFKQGKEELVKLIPEDGRFHAFPVTQEWYLRNKPTSGDLAGGYWVRYDNGYQSWSPAKAFDDGYTLATELTPELLNRMRSVIAKDLISDEEFGNLNQMVMNELIEENRGVIGGPDVIHMQHPRRLAEAAVEMALNKLKGLA